MPQLTIEERNEKVREESAFLGTLLESVESIIVGQREMVRRILVGLLADGHLLLEGVPGLAKTLAVKTVAQAIHATFHRIQFTPDLLPADLTGTLIFDPTKGSFTPKFGPVFTQILLADEINRAPAKVQSALLEAMQERQVTIGDTTYPLEGLFWVLATQNPIEHEGTYPLPEAQMDRFLLKIRVGYPSPEEEGLILDRMGGELPAPPKPVIAAKKILDSRHLVNAIYLDERIRGYIVDLVHATREPERFGLDLRPLIQYGASPRATLALARGSRALAFLEGRAYVTPDDIKGIAPDVFRHRILLTYEAEAEGVPVDEVTRRILARVEVP
ncbi:MAG: MoxR family ATPase [Candidatus Eisenbacteria bacterium]|uniref:MoxR family ATPase n=1 Tax=Eiseniibacteriota bacterium TaxID=2212470 RepID=A0A538SY60_UNCEI|nr:MAG: MoxR family ATPase [Candidatus Eisenbacteria bacterium]TMQ66169.1 MAG: MoxR family ATPase [Candidatus Eisenbacteria bacterium]